MIDHVGAHRVERRGVQQVGALAAPDDRGVAPGAEAGEALRRLGDGRVVAAPQRDGEEIDEAALRFMAHFGWDAFPPRGGHEFRQDTSHFGHGALSRNAGVNR
jgi:hypothetical protein